MWHLKPGDKMCGICKKHPQVAASCLQGHLESGEKGDRGVVSTSISESLSRSSPSCFQIIFIPSFYLYLQSQIIFCLLSIRFTVIFLSNCRSNLNCNCIQCSGWKISFAKIICTVLQSFQNSLSTFHSDHPTGWAESISGIGLCMWLCVSVITSKMIIISARRLHRPL